jgi:glucose/arabinose dehydrogenase
LDTPNVSSDAGVPSDASVDTEAPVDVACVPGQSVEVGALGLELVATSNDLDSLSYAVQPPASNDWYLVQQNGRIRVLKDGALLPDVFYDVSAEMTFDPSYDERGLHAIAFPPDYETSGRFYVALTPTTGDRANRDLVLEHSRGAADTYVAEMTPTKELLATEGISPNSLFVNIHNNYLLAFGPDEMLYVGTGDGGGSCNDNAGFEDTPQELDSTFGKILRLDPDAEAPYAAAGNPFVDSGDPRVFHYGLRNPFRFSWDSATGDLYIGDVGQDTHEEINFAPAGSMGLNFGWAAWEGDEQVCQNRPANESTALTAPIFFTDHGGGGQFGAGCDTSPFCDYGAIVGGVVYRGTAIDELYGAYVFGDWVSDNMAVIRQCEGTTSPVTSIDYTRDPNLPDNGYFVKVGEGVPDISSITAVVQGNDQELYIVANRNALLRIVPAP